MQLDRADDVAKQPVTCIMAVAVVDLFESVDVDVGEHESRVSVASAVDLALEREQSKLATQRAGELIDLRAAQLGSRLLAIVRGGEAICRGRGRRPRAARSLAASSRSEERCSASAWPRSVLFDGCRQPSDRGPRPHDLG